MTLIETLQRIDPGQRSQTDKRILADGAMSRRGYINTGPGFNRGLEDEFRQKWEYLKDSGDLEWDDEFATPNSDNHMKQVYYCSKHGFMKVLFAKSGKNSSDTVIFDGVPAGVFYRLKAKANHDGRCGRLFWDFFRYRHTRTGTRTPYWHE